MGGKGFDQVGRGFRARCRIDGFGEVDMKSVRRDADAFDLGGHEAGPFKTFQRKGFQSAHGPASVGAAAKKAPFRCQLDIENAGRETLTERVAGALPDPVELLGGGAHDQGLGAIAS